MAEPLLAVENLEAGYGPFTVLHAVKLTVYPGEIVAVIGPNGAGKSTILKAIFGQAQIFAGRILWRGQPVTGRPPRQLLRLGLAYVPQGQVVFPSLSVRENLLIGARSIGQSAGEGQLAEICQYFPDLKGLLDRRAGLLSGGQQQMVAIARSLLIEPALLLMDEPSLGLAPALVEGMFARITDLGRRGTSILLVEQNARRALAAAHRGYVLELGRNRFTDTGKNLLADQRVQDLYLGGRMKTE